MDPFDEISPKSIFPTKDDGLEFSPSATMSQALIVPNILTKPPSRKTSIYPQHERMKGWLKKMKPRPKGERIDKFYIHIRSDIQFRSLNEVDDFVILGLHPCRTRKNNMEGQNSIGESSTKKRSCKRDLTWIFVVKGYLSEEAKIYDIKCLGEDAYKDSNNLHLFMMGPKSPTLSEETLSDYWSEDESGGEGKKKAKMTESEVKAFFRDSYNNLIKQKVVFSNPKDNEVVVKAFLTEAYNNLMNENAHNIPFSN